MKRPERCQSDSVDCSEPAETNCISCGTPLCYYHANICTDGPRCNTCKDEVEFDVED